jgi:hypothetical protein
MSVTMPSSTTTAPARFLMLGDSHLGPLGRAAKAARISFQGGPIGAGRDFFDDFFTAQEHDIVFHVPEMERYFRGFLDELDITCLDELAIPLVSTIGFSTHFVATQHNWIYYRGAAGYPADFLSSPLFEDIVVTMAAPALSFYRQMRAFNLRVVAVLPAQRVPGQSDPVIFVAAQDVVRQHVAKIGIEIVDLRDRIIDETGFQRRELSEENDEIHGNLAWGRIVLSELLDLGL